MASRGYLGGVPAGRVCSDLGQGARTWAAQFPPKQLPAGVLGSRSTITMRRGTSKPVPRGAVVGSGRFVLIASGA